MREATEFLVIREPMLCKWKKDYKQGKLQAFLGNGPKLEVEAKKRQSLSVEIQKFHGQSRNRYGYRRFHASLVRKGVKVGRNGVQGIRSHAGIRSCQVKTKAKLYLFYRWYQTVILSGMNASEFASSEIFDQQLKREIGTVIFRAFYGH